MINKKILLQYDFETMQEYYDYILNSKQNGNFSQVENLFKALGKDQKKEFLSSLADSLKTVEQGSLYFKLCYETLKACIEFI